MVRHEHHNNGVFYLILSLFAVAFVSLIISSPAASGTETTGVAAFFGNLFWVTLCAAGFVSVLATISYMQRMTENLDSMVDDLRRIRTAQIKQDTILTEINNNSVLSDTIKSIVFRDRELKTLEDSAMQSIRQGKTETIEWLIDQIRSKFGAVELSEKLVQEIARTLKLSDQEKANEYIKHLESLWSIHDYRMAANEEKELLNRFPENDAVLALRGQTEIRRQAHKTQLLEKMEIASRNNDHELCVEILKMLDMHLTPTEAVALQETARDVLRSRLHSLGVQFSLAVTGKEWARAYRIGMSIVKDYPNSRMAQEVREKMTDLQNLANDPDSRATV